MKNNFCFNFKNIFKDHISSKKRGFTNLLFSSVLIIFLTGCSEENMKWEEANEQKTAQGYDEYLTLFPKGEYSAIAKTKIDSLRKSVKAKCLVIISGDEVNNDRRYIGTFHVMLKDVNGILSRENIPATPSIYLWRSISSRDTSHQIKIGVVYLFNEATDKYISMGKIDFNLTNDQVAKLFNIDFPSANISKADSTGTRGNWHFINGEVVYD
jgi:hypothetical protein